MILFFIINVHSLLQQRYKTEIIVRTISNFWNLEKIDSFVEKCVVNKVNIVSVSFKQDEDESYISGSLFYSSSIGPVAEDIYSNTNMMEYLISKCHNNSIKVYAWIPQFHDQAALLKNSEWKMMYLENGILKQYKGSNPNFPQYFVNPINSDLQNYELSIIKEIVDSFSIDGVMLDWLRFDSFNMDLSDYTRDKYIAKYGKDPINFDFSLVDNSNYTQLEEWNNWRTEFIGDYVRRVRETIGNNIVLGAYVLSPFWTDVGQDVSKFQQYIDLISPMCYFEDFKEQRNWVYKENGIIDLTIKKSKESKIRPVLSTHWTSDDYDDVLAHIASKYPSIESLSVFYYHEWGTKQFSLINNISMLMKEVPEQQKPNNSIYFIIAGFCVVICAIVFFIYPKQKNEFIKTI